MFSLSKGAAPRQAPLGDVLSKDKMPGILVITSHKPVSGQRPAHVANGFVSPNLIASID